MKCVVGEQRYEIIDTPGMYSLMPITEEAVGRRILLHADPHVVVHVIIRAISNGLPMTLQLVEAGLPLAVVNIWMRPNIVSA